MTGTGTQTDPYIIENWADFFNITDSAAYYKLGCNLDANDYNDGVWTACTLSCKELDGDGHEIRNINNISISDNQNAFDITSSCRIKSLILKQCLQTATGTVAYGFFAIASNVAANFDECKIEVKSPYIFQYKSTTSSSCNFAKSILSFDGKSLNTTAYQQGNIERCNVYLDMYDNQSKVGFGKMYSSSVGGRLFSTSASTVFNFGSSTGAVSDCVIALESNCAFKINDTATSPTIVDGQLCASVSGTGVISATSEQMQSLTWLEDNGLTVIKQ